MARRFNGRAGREPGCRGGPHPIGATLAVELRDPGRVHLLEGRVPVGRHVHRVAGREERARRAPGIVAAARSIARLIATLLVASPLVWKTTTFGGRTPVPNVFSVR